MKKLFAGLMVFALTWFSMGTCALANNYSQSPTGQQGRMPTRQQGGIPGQGQAGNIQNRNAASSTTGSKISVYINGAKQDFSSDPVNMNGSVLVPMRSLFESVGGNVQWENSTRTVTANRGNTNVRLSIGNNVGYINNGQQQLDAAPQLINGNTYIPIRFLCEAFGATVDWENGVIYIELPEDMEDDSNYNYSNSIYYNQNDDLDDIVAAINNTFEDAGDDYFDDDGIECAITLSGNEDDLVYRVKLDFDDADDYDDLKDLDEDDIEAFLDDLEDELYDEIDNTDYEDADITGYLIDNDNSRYYVRYNGSYYSYSWTDEDDLDDIIDAINDTFEDAGDDYFDDDGIECAITLSGDEDDLLYKVKLVFDDADNYDDLADLDEDDIEEFLDDLESEISDEIDDTDFEDADITGYLIDNDNSRYYVKYNGSYYSYSWD